MADAKTEIKGSLQFSRSILRELTKLGELKAAMVIKGQYPNGRSVAQIAAIQEFGTARIPARPFVRHALRSVGEVQAVLRAESAAITSKNRKAPTACRRVAQAMAALVVRAIDESPGWAKPNAPETVRRKGSDHPLIDTGLLRRSVHWRVVRGSATAEEGPSVK
jgi:hypothetical protein